MHKTSNRKREIEFVIGIDPGVKTGFACREVNGKDPSFTRIETYKIHKAMSMVQHYDQMGGCFVFVEDARLNPANRYFANKENRKGLGSIMRDAQIWEDFLKDNNIPHRMVKPLRSNTKWDSRTFKRITGWNGRTNEHSRDAGVLCLQNPAP